MQRFTGQPIPDDASAAMITSDALGNYVVATPLFQMLKVAHPNLKVDYYGGTRVAELAQAEPLIDRHFSLYGHAPHTFRPERSYDLVINFEFSAYAMVVAAMLAGEKGIVVGPAVSDDGRGDLAWGEDDLGRLASDSDWTSADLRTRFPFLDSSFIGEIFCRISGLKGAMPMPRVAIEATESPADLIVSATAKTPDKLWPVENWVRLVEEVNGKGRSVGVVGAKPSQSQFWTGGDAEQRMVEAGALDLRGVYTLPQVGGVLQSCRCTLSLDNGLLHMAAAVGGRCVGLYRHGIHRLWAPPVPSLTVLEPGPDRNVADIPYDRVVAALQI